MSFQDVTYCPILGISKLDRAQVTMDQTSFIGIQSTQCQGSQLSVRAQSRYSAQPSLVIVQSG